jgi:6-phosphofructokinase 1
MAVVGIPKTIDNDIAYCDRTFGFVTAVERAQEVIDLAHNEARGAPRGIGLVKVMGRAAGFIACYATLASQEANFTLIPEISFALEGEHGLLSVLERRMDERQHAVIVVAEGAGQDLFGKEEVRIDASGNRRFHDIGPFLKQQMGDYFNRLGRPVEIKYIDPSYIIPPWRPTATTACCATIWRGTRFMPRWPGRPTS